MTVCSERGCMKAPNYLCGCTVCAAKTHPNERYAACTDHTETCSAEHQKELGRGVVWFWFDERPPLSGTPGQKKYAVRMSAMARMRGTYRTEADSPEHAETIAREHSGDVAWKYDGTDDESIEVDSVTEDP